MAITTNTNTAGAQNNTLDPNQRKKPPILPYVAPGKNLQPVQPATNPFTGDGQPFAFNAPTPPQIDPNAIKGIGSGYQENAGNQAVLGAAQNRALQGFQSPTLDQTSQLTQQLLQNPQMGFNPQQQLQRSLEQFDVERANAMEAARQGMAGTMHSGQTRGDFMDLAIQGAQQRAGFEADQQEALRQEQLRNLLAALAEGRSTSETERQRFATDIGALVDVRGAAEGMENRTFQGAESAMDRGMQLALVNQDAQLQTNLTELRGKIEQGLLLTRQDFEGIQADLDRQMQAALANNDTATAITIQQMKNEFGVQMQQAEQQFQRAERVATQAYMTSERLSEQDFETAQRYLQHELNEAMADNDVERQSYLLDKQAQWDLKRQTNAFDQQTKMAYLESQLEEAKAQNDVGRQKQIIQFQTQQEAQLLAQEQGFQEAQSYLQRQHELAVQENDIVAQQAIQTASIEANAREAALDRSHDLKMQELQQAFAERGMSWEAVMSNLEALPAEQAAQVLWSEGQAAGLDMGPNPALLREVASIRENQIYPGDDNKQAAWINRARELGLSQEEAEEIWNYQGDTIVNSGYVQEAATLIRNGGYAAAGVDYTSPEGQAIIGALSRDTTLMEGNGSKEKVTAGRNYNIWTNLEKAYNSGEPIMYEGKPAVVTNVARITGAGTNKSEYTINFLEGGTTTSIT